MYQFDFSGILDPAVWLPALATTFGYAVVTIIGGLIIGMFVGVGLLSGKLWLRGPLNLYVQFFRCTPVMVQIIWFYYALPMLTGHNIPAGLAAGGGLTLYMGSFCAEIFRGGVISTDQGQWNAARALGMSYSKMMIHIILPQAIRRMIPPFVSQCILQFKNTSLLYVVAVPDLMYTSYEMTSRTYRPLEVYSTVALIYFAILFPATIYAKKLEARNNR